MQHKAVREEENTNRAARKRRLLFTGTLSQLKNNRSVSHEGWNVRFIFCQPTKKSFRGLNAAQELQPWMSLYGGPISP